MVDRVRTLLLGAVMVVLGTLALPLSAFVLDGSNTGENLIVPVALVVSCGIGALLALPVLGPDLPARRRAVVGAGLGLLGLVVGVVVFFLLISGLDGA